MRRTAISLYFWRMSVNLGRRGFKQHPAKGLLQKGFSRSENRLDADGCNILNISKCKRSCNPDKVAINAPRVIKADSLVAKLQKHRWHEQFLSMVWVKEVGLAIYTSNHPRIFNASDFIHIIISDDWLTWAGLCGFETIWLHNAFDAWQFFKPKAGWIWRFPSSWQWLILTHETENDIEWLPLCIWLLFDTETESKQNESECDSDLKLNLSVTLISRRL